MGKHSRQIEYGWQGVLEKHDCLISLLFLTVPNILAFAFLWPGYFQADHQTAIARIAIGAPRQQHSLTWGYTAFPLIYLSPHYSIYGLVQLNAFVLCAYACACRLKRLGIVRLTTPLCAFYGLFPTYLLYNELWGTDLCFAYALMILTSLLVELVVRGGDALGERPFLLGLAVTILVMTLLRKNAILISVFLCLALPLTFRDRCRQALVACVLPTALALLIDGWFFPNVVGATKSAQSEFLSVPSEQIARVYATGAKVPDDINAVLTQDRTEEEWAQAYLPYCSDFAKLGRTLTPEFLTAWARLGMLYPSTYLDAYVELMRPFWTFGEARGYGYGIGFTTDFEIHENFTRVFAEEGLREGYLSEFNGKKAKSRLWLWPRKAERLADEHLPWPMRLVFYDALFNRGLPLWALVVGLVVSARKRDYLIIAGPCICVMATLLAFAPVASFRYLLGCYYTLPLVGIVLAHHLGWFWSVRSMAKAHS